MTLLEYTALLSHGCGHSSDWFCPTCSLELAALLEKLTGLIRKRRELEIITSLEQSRIVLDQEPDKL